MALSTCINYIIHLLFQSTVRRAAFDTVYIMACFLARVASSSLLILAFDPLVFRWETNRGGFAAVGAFVVPGGAPSTPEPRAKTCHDGLTTATTASSARCCLVDRRRCGRSTLLSVAPEAEKIVAEDGARVASVTGREAVELAAERLAPIFTEVDAHTQRWVRSKRCSIQSCCINQCVQQYYNSINRV